MIRENLIDRIWSRLSGRDIADVIAALERARGDVIFDHTSARHGGEIVTRYRQDARGAIREYRVLRYRDALSKLTKALHDREGDMLRERARNAASLYLDARRDQRDLTALAAGRGNLLQNDG